MDIIQPLLRHAAATPKKIALRYGDVQITFAELRDAINNAAMHLAQHGIEAGHQVGVRMGNTPLHLIVLLGLARLGAVSVPITQSGGAELVERLGLKLVLHPAGRPPFTAKDVPGDVRQIGIGPEVVNTGVPGAAVKVKIPTNLGPRVWRLATSSGTTGKSKIIALTQHNTALQSALVQGRSEYGPKIVLMPCLALTIQYAVGIILRQLHAGGTVVLPSSFEIKDFIADIKRHKVNAVEISTGFAEKFAAALAGQPKGRGPLFPQIVYFGVGGSTVTPALEQLLRKRITPNVVVSYGSTECGGMAKSIPALRDSHPHVTGVLLPWIEGEAVNEKNQPLPPGKVGALRFRGPACVQRYEGDPEATAKSFRNGWFYPGDRGAVLAWGGLVLAGRTDELLNIGGNKVDPTRIEAVLKEDPSITDIAVFQTVNAQGKTILAAAVVAPNGFNGEALRQRCVDALGKDFAPTHFREMTELPRNATQKVMRRKLKALAVPADSSNE